MPFKVGSVAAIAAVLLASGCHGRSLLEGHSGMARTWDGSLFDVDEWLSAFLSDATSLDLPATRTTPDDAMSNPLMDADVDFAAIVTAELESRKPGVSADCESCVVPLAVKACKEAWSKLMIYCKAATDDKSKAACQHYRDHPADFIVKRVLRASVNPIDGGYTYCWWRGKC